MRTARFSGPSGGGVYTLCPHFHSVHKPPSIPLLSTHPYAQVHARIHTPAQVHAGIPPPLDRQKPVKHCLPAASFTGDKYLSKQNPQTILGNNWMYIILSYF